MEENKKTEATTTIQVEIKVQAYDINKGELIDAIASSAKLTKADAGRALDATIESVTKDVFKLRIAPTSTPQVGINCPTVDMEYTTKVYQP